MELGAIDLVWNAIYGNPAWSVRKGHGSFLTFEFGAPSLRILEPAYAPDCNRAALVRRVDVVGAWHLWIYCCNWTISFDGSNYSHNESPDNTISSAVERLDGQRITSVTRGAARGSWVFQFDLGGRLDTWPYTEDAEDEQWMLYERQSGHVLVAHANDSVFYGPDAERSDGSTC